ncbi:MAG: PAS domain-containing protein [Pedobacter sp.]|nr:PAS domain-containing protein [Pedobacter sp.]MDQ8051422.1 PAS domain-containing protein [Pedobacter sp.]
MLLADHQLLQILSQSNLATAVYGSDELHIHFANRAMLALWRKQPNIIGSTLEEAMPELVGQPFGDILRKVWKTGQAYRDTDTPADLMKDGRLVRAYYDFEFRPILDSEGQTIAIIHEATDVTARLQAQANITETHNREQELISKLTQSNDDFKITNQKLQDSNDNINILNLRLQESETDFKRLVEQAPVAILVFRGENLVIDIANAAMLEILDKDPDIIGRPILDSMPELRGEPAVDLLFDVYHSGRVEEGIEVPVRIRKGNVLETRYFNFSYRPLMDHGKIVGVMDVAVEVTAQVLARQELRANEQRLQGILDTMAEGLIIVNMDGMPNYANLTALRILGLSDEEFNARFYNDLKWKNERLDGTLLPDKEHPIYTVLHEARSVYDYELATHQTNGDRKYLSINAAPLLDAEGKLIGAIATFTDVTHRRLLMQQKDDFISVASHELKTPITSLKAAIQLLDRMKHNIHPEMLLKLIDQSNRSLNKLSELVSSLLNTNRIAEGRFPINKQQFKIGDMLAECREQVASATSQEIQLSGDLDLEILGDRQLLEQVVINLLNNAIKYAHNSPTIQIRAEKLPDAVKVAVSDTGPGIDPEKIPHIFERYYRADREGMNFSGLGLGLFISAEIISRHNGEIGVDSIVDQGTTFWFKIPVFSS